MLSQAQCVLGVHARRLWITPHTEFCIYEIMESVFCNHARPYCVSDCISINCVILVESEVWLRWDFWLRLLIVWCVSRVIVTLKTYNSVPNPGLLRTLMWHCSPSLSRSLCPCLCACPHANLCTRLRGSLLLIQVESCHIWLIGIDRLIWAAERHLFVSLRVLALFPRCVWIHIDAFW